MKSLHAIIITSGALILSACGGGGGGSTPPSSSSGGTSINCDTNNQQIDGVYQGCTRDAKLRTSNAYVYLQGFFNNVGISDGNTNRWAYNPGSFTNQTFNCDTGTVTNDGDFGQVGIFTQVYDECSYSSGITFHSGQRIVDQTTWTDSIHEQTATKNSLSMSHSVEGWDAIVTGTSYVATDLNAQAGPGEGFVINELAESNNNSIETLSDDLVIVTTLDPFSGFGATFTTRELYMEGGYYHSEFGKVSYFTLAPVIFENGSLTSGFIVAQGENNQAVGFEFIDADTVTIHFDNDGNETIDESYENLLIESVLDGRDFGK